MAEDYSSLEYKAVKTSQLLELLEQLGYGVPVVTEHYVFGTVTFGKVCNPKGNFCGVLYDPEEDILKGYDGEFGELRFFEQFQTLVEQLLDVLCHEAGVVVLHAWVCTDERSGIVWHLERGIKSSKMLFNEYDELEWG